MQEQAAKHGFHYTALRPNIVTGGTTSVNMNPIALLGVYAALLREQGLPLSYPGEAGLGISQLTDSRLLASACLHVATNDVAWDRALNVTNGDVFEWRSVWPAIARSFGMEAGEDRPLDLANFILEHRKLWASIVRKYHLASLEDVADFLGESLHYGRMIFSATPRPFLMSSVALARTGFTDVVDSLDGITYWVKDLQDRKLLPDPNVQSREEREKKA
jgi:nucleoside-diphosphate-sugar epimerase